MMPIHNIRDNKPAILARAGITSPFQSPTLRYTVTWKIRAFKPARHRSTNLIRKDGLLYNRTASAENKDQPVMNINPNPHRVLGTPRATTSETGDRFNAR